MKSRLALYYRLTKPGIVYGNTISLIAGFFYYAASGGTVSVLALIYAVCGTALVMASACVANNIIDKDIDVYMARTSKRSLVTGQISSLYAGIYSAILLALGIGILTLTNITVVAIALSAWLLYVFPYTYLKRTTYHATLVGSLPGAAPPLIGYYAAGGSSATVALFLFLAIAAWQMVHFYAISIFRQQEYAAAHVPIITVVKGIPATVRHMQIWALISAATLFATALYANALYAVLVLVMTGWWLRATVYVPGDDIKWSRKLFFASLLFLVLWLVVAMVAGLFSLVLDI